MKNEKFKSNVDVALLQMLQKKASYDKMIAFSQSSVDDGSFIKIAYDLYRVDNDPYESLWSLETVNGKQYLVRASDMLSDVTASEEWTALSDYDKKNVTLYYKDVPISRFSSDEYGFSSDTAPVFKSALLDKVKHDSEFVKAVFAEKPQSMKVSLTQTFPELKKFI